MLVSNRVIELVEAVIPGLNDLNESGAALQAIFPAGTLLGEASESDDVLVEVHAGAPATHVDAAMQSLYSNIHSTFAHLQVYGGLRDVTHTYLARRKDRLLAVFLLRRDGNTVHVINEGMTVDEAELERFAGHLFSIWRSVSAICLHAVDSQVRVMPRPLQQYACTANIVLPLPATADDYVASLGKNMRRNLRRYMDKLKRDHPSLQVEVAEKADASEADMRAIIDLNRVRIAGKNMRYGLDDEVEKVMALVRQCGMVLAMRIDGRVVAGSIGYFAGSHYFFKVISHDPRYNEYSAGILCCYLTICECIARGCKEYNFMWNEYDYKFALGAHARSLHHVVVYRSRLHFLLRPRLAMSNAAAAWRHRVSALFEKASKEESLSGGERAFVRVLEAARSAKRALLRRGS
ncbi:GNAT family N-acetyltransferase [Noviherbaspirillum sp. ST9]|uniref:GNAT family N-acetyltransferase n=1 Tax=Noviherbaspirillum sp. ST9 TaxID=3401606 RepID=UPI003B5874C8